MRMILLELNNWDSFRTCLSPPLLQKRQDLSCNLSQRVVSKDSRRVNTLEKRAGRAPIKHFGYKCCSACVKEGSASSSCQWNRSKLCISSVWNHRLLSWLSGFSLLEWAVHGYNLLSHPVWQWKHENSYFNDISYFVSTLNHMESCMKQKSTVVLELLSGSYTILHVQKQFFFGFLFILFIIMLMAMQAFIL